ncbi:C-X-C chemokine receptor type 1-like isoform X2 [Betta splendens]|uniref:C-X-C chemokine receptor type 1-like isoform X2 n=1 Tax=Betta splendens TaxID=158456 RepID=A0A6P7KTQ3_BETSP|nr:C-X-C chemokine receptor type 1-like isoform X2 [Betta splendens]XP_028985924.1 C-X-C chemokine receptor type 1-like isoform X2 [Betta splendens]XP_055359106.1 C-X-C chemokine receptor type 1-like isoform X2 [Betta splendens]
MDVDVGGFLTQNTTYDYSDYERKHWRISDIFVLNLAISDALLLGTLPFWAAQAAQQSGWCFGAALCKICGAIFNMNFYCGILLLCCISLYHYLSIIHSVQLPVHHSHREPMLVHASCLAVWLVSLLLTIPDWIFLEPTEPTTQTKPLCVHTYTTSSANWQLGPRLLHHVLGLLVPTATLVVCCSGILLRLHFKNLKQQRAVTLLLLAGVFFVFWLPYNVTLMVDTYRSSSKDSQRSSFKALPATFALACVHACLRPVIYVFLSGNFRKWTLAVLRCEAADESKGEVRSSLWELGVREKALPAQNHELENLKQTTGAEQPVQSA